MYYDDFFSAWEPDPTIVGPFATEDDLIQGVINRYASECYSSLAQRVNYYRRVLPRILKNGEGNIFSHGDLQRKNIIIQPDGSDVLVDWATGGWYPSYWEYAMAMVACGNWKDDWHAYLAKILDEYPNQYVWINTMRLELWT